MPIFHSTASAAICVAGPKVFVTTSSIPLAFSRAVITPISTDPTSTKTAAQIGTTTAIIKALFERGVPTPGEYKASKGQNYHDVSRAGHIWQRSTLVRMLADERYTGIYIMGKRRCVEVGSNHVRMRDKSEWIKIPDHHPALISHELYEQLQEQFHHGACVKKNRKDYLLRDKVFCGCCRHALRRIGNKTFRFVFVHSKPNSTAPCHGLTIREGELESLIYEPIVKQAQTVSRYGAIRHKPTRIVICKARCI